MDFIERVCWEKRKFGGLLMAQAFHYALLKLAGLYDKYIGCLQRNLYGVNFEITIIRNPAYDRELSQFGVFIYEWMKHRILMTN